MIITAVLKSHFYIIVALASITGSVIATPYISNFVGVVSSDTSSLGGPPTALAQSLPHEVDHHVPIGERVGDPVKVYEWMNDADRNCEMSCTFAEFQPGRHGKAGLAYITESPIDLSGARRVHFFLMGEEGGEMVKVYLAGKPRSGGQAPDNPGQAPDHLFRERFARSTGVITLTNDWQRYEIPLGGVDLEGITAPFAIELLRGRNTGMQGVYFKFITYENQAVDPRFALAANGTDNATTTALTAEDNATALTAEDNATALTAEDNATTTAPNNNGVGGNNNSRSQSDENVEPNNNGSRNRSNPTAADAIGGVDNNNTATGTSDEQTANTSTNDTLVEDQDNENAAPIAMTAVSSLVAHPGDTVILDGSLSSDPDGDVITYQWSQSEGPSAEIEGPDTATPMVTIPNVGRNEQISIDLVVSDGQAESTRASVLIDIPYVEEIEDAIQQDLLPNAGRQGMGGAWSVASCDGNGAAAIVECLTDGSHSTFVSSDRPGITTDILFSFQDPSSVGINPSNQIAYVTAQFSAKKIGTSGFASLIVDRPTNNEHYNTPSISIISDSFEEYSFTWQNNPITGEPWTVDSLNAFVAGFRHMAGQGSIQISEFKLIVANIVVVEEQEESLPSSPPPTDEEIPSTTEPESSPAEEEENGNVNNGNDDEDNNNSSTPEEEGSSSPDDSNAASEESAPVEDNE